MPVRIPCANCGCVAWTGPAKSPWRLIPPFCPKSMVPGLTGYISKDKIKFQEKLKVSG